MQIVALVVLPTILAVVAAMLLARRRIVSSREFDADSVSFVGGALSALFTVVLAFYVVFAWQVGSDIQSSSDAEANALIDAYEQVAVAPQPAQDTVRGLVRDYAGEVADREWPSLRDRDAEDPNLDRLLDRVRAVLTALPTTDPGIALAREQGLRDVRQIDESHRSRVSSATGNNVFNHVLLGGTVAGAALMLAFPLLAGMSRRPANVVFIGILAAALGSVVYLSLQLARPLDGPFGVDPSSFSDAFNHLTPSTT